MNDLSLPPLRVLIVDDDDDQRFLLRRQFARAGIEQVREASTADQALERIAEERPDLIVLDIAMPGRSGLEALPDVRVAAGEAPVVMLSNFSRRKLEEQARQRGAVGYVEKRTPAGQLVRAIVTAAALVGDLVGDLTQQVSEQLEASPTSARRARQLVRGLVDPGDQELLEAAELLVTELVTNSVLHASSAPQLEVRIDEQRLRVEVHDADPTLPVLKDPGPAATGGRGVLLLDRMASRWGAEPHEAGKVVWFELDR